jgi:hypothetical protein
MRESAWLWRPAKAVCGNVQTVEAMLGAVADATAEWNLAGFSLGRSGVENKKDADPHALIPGDAALPYHATVAGQLQREPVGQFDR